MFAILVAHLVLVCAFGQHYAKLDLPHPTEFVLGALLVFGLGAVQSVPWDAITRRTALFVSFGLGVVLLSGVPTGTGVKAFSFFVYAGFYWVVRGLATTDRRGGSCSMRSRWRASSRQGSACGS